MSLTVAQSPPYCSHPSSPASCSPSPIRIQSPVRTRGFGSIPRSSAASPLPFLLGKNRRYSDNMDASTSANVMTSPGAYVSAEQFPLSHTPLFEEPQQRASPSSAAVKFLRSRKSFSAIQAKMTLQRENKGSARRSLLDPRQHRKTERSSSGSDAENEMETDGPGTVVAKTKYRDSTRQKRHSGAMVKSDMANIDHSLGHEALPRSPRRRGRAKRHSVASGLASHFEQVSVTPPARLQKTASASPFTSFAQPEAPATDVRRSRIPRSRAFGPFVPLQEDPASESQHDEGETRMPSAVPMRRSAHLQMPGMAPFSAPRQQQRPPIPSSLATILSIPKDRKMALRADSIEELSPRPRRRRAAHSPASGKRTSMRVDEIMDTSSSPLSPSPGDVSYPTQDASLHTAYASCDSEEEEDEDDANILRPGVYVPTRRVSGARSGVVHASPFTGKSVSMGRSTTASSIEEGQSSAVVSSTIKIDTRTQQTPFKTPNKRRARNHTSSASRTRLLSQASPIAAPVESEEGSLFGSASGSSLGRDRSVPDMQNAVVSASRDPSLRSLGSGSQSTWLDTSASPHSFSSSTSTWETPAASLQYFTPPFSLSRQPRKLSLGADNPSDTPHHIGYDDSGVAFGSPAFSLASLQKPVDARNNALQAFKSAQSIEMQSSPSKVAALRRKSVEHSAPSKPRVSHPFSVRERSALANEARWSDGDSSAASTPNLQRSVVATTSAPEGLASPASKAASGSAEKNTSLRTADGDQSSYFTPQPFKSVLPLQAAFLSTGLASKRAKAGLGDVDPVSGEPIPHLPSKLNYGATRGHVRASSGSTMASSLGLRDVVAAANAHAVASSMSSAPSAMPDTPMKKPSASFAPKHGLAVDRQVAPVLGQPMLALKPGSLSPGSADGNESSSSGGGSPLLTQACESPTMNISSHGAARNMHSAHPILMLEAESPQAKATSPATKEPERDFLVDPASARRAAAHMSLPTRGFSLDDALRANLPQRPVSLMRPPLGLQRKSSFGATSEQGNSLATHSVLSDAVPSTPTRGNVHIKWYEAAQLTSTPSPTNRSDARERKRDSWQMGSLRSKGIRPVSSKTRNAAVVTSLGTPRQPKLLPAVARRSFYDDNFNVISTLGRGEFSQVDKAEDKRDGSFYAVKRMKKAYVGPRDRLRRLEEVDVLRLLNDDGAHPNIVSFIDAWEEKGHLFIQTELCPCVDFASFLQHFSNMGGSLDEARLWKVFRELAEGLRFIHDKNVLHLDLKPANIFITEIATLKIGDFGFATRWPQASAVEILANAGLDDVDNLQSEGPSLPQMSKGLEREGDREYIAPEIISQGTYGKAADVFSLGLIMLEAAGDVNLPDNGEAWHKLRRNDLSDVDLSELSISIIQLLRRSLCADAEERATIEEICEHPVLQAVGASVAKGVQVSELDQLPVFDLPNTESSRSLHRARTASRGDDDTDMAEEDVDLGSTPHTPTMEIALSHNITVGAMETPPQDLSSVAMDRQTSAASTSSAFGVEGLNEDDKVLDVRGALIHENLDFLLMVLDAEPDANARLPSGAVQQREQSSQGFAPFVVPTISIDDEDAQSALFALSPPSKFDHTPSRASPLRQAFYNDDNASFDMDMDM